MGRLAAAGLLLALTAAACAYRGGGQIDDPLSRRLTWLSYVAGDDIRAACGPAAGPDRYRVVYNGLYEAQVRSYEVVGDGAGGAFLVARAFGPANLARIEAADPLAPWRGRRAETRLDAGDLAAFERALAASGFLATPPVGLRLPSDSVWWFASGCADGRFRYSAWRVRGPAAVAPPVAGFLLERDETGLPVNRPTATGAAALGPRGARDERAPRIDFTLEVTEEGLAGLARPF